MLTPLGGTLNPLGMAQNRVPWYLSDGIDPATVVAAYQPKGAASLAASYVNLANPGTYNAAPGVVPTFDVATGWEFNGLTQYLTTGIIAVNGWTMLCQFAGGSGTATRMLCGSYSSSATSFYLMPIYQTTNRHYYGQGGQIGAGIRLNAGNMGVSGQQGFLNGNADGASIPNWSGTGIRSFLIGCYKSSMPTYFWNGSIQALVIYNVTRSAAQMLTVATAMAAL